MTCNTEHVLLNLDCPEECKSKERQIRFLSQIKYERVDTRVIAVWLYLWNAVSSWLMLSHKHHWLGLGSRLEPVSWKRVKTVTCPDSVCVYMLACFFLCFFHVILKDLWSYPSDWWPQQLWGKEDRFQEVGLGERLKVFFARRFDFFLNMT